MALWDVETGSLIRPFDDSLITSWCMTIPVFSPDDRLAAGSNGGGPFGWPDCENSAAELLIWDIATGEVVRTIRAMNTPSWGTLSARMDVPSSA